MNENDARVKAYMKAAGLIKTTEDSPKKEDLSIKLPSNVRLEKNDNANPEKDSIYRRVAKYLLLIGIDEAAKIIPHLSPEQTEKIIPEIASIRSVDPDEANVILAEFENLVQRSREDGGVSTAKAILVKAFGQERAEQMLQKTVPFPNGKPFDYMQEMEGERVFFLLKEESSAVQALVLSHLKPKVAANVINQMELNAKTEVVRRLATLKKIDPEILRRVDQAMQEKVKTSNTSKSDSIDGRGALADILKKMSPDSEKNILSMLSDTDPDLGIDLRQRLFTVDDVLNCDDRVMQEKLHQMTEIEIAYLIAGKSQDFRDKIFKNISKGRGDIVLEEENLHKPMLKKDCETVTAEFFSYLRRKWESGELRIIGRDDDQYV
ncbi:MAG: hypothetical protein J6Q47_04745 [Paludibacteraceae bacterium]|nr:hypothetical protein [Paludibacteraceae bacterium]